MSRFLLEAINVLDFEVGEECDGICARCGYVPDPDIPALHIMEINLWAATCLSEQPEHGVDGYGSPILLLGGEPVTEQDVVWVVLCGDCLHQLPRVPCQPLYLELGD